MFSVCVFISLAIFIVFFLFDFLLFISTEIETAWEWIQVSAENN